MPLDKNQTIILWEDFKCIVQIKVTLMCRFCWLMDYFGSDFCNILVMWDTIQQFWMLFCRDSESDEPLWTVRYQARLILCECYTPNLPQRLGVRTLNQWFVLPSRLGLWNTPTDSLQRAKTPLPTSVLSRRVPPPISVLDMTLNNLMVRFQ